MASSPTRTHSTRKDEIGELSRSFDEMAGRIETLLSAERRLLQDVSHELRSPLTRLDVAVDLASTSDDPGEYLGRIKRDIGRLSVLVNELLQLTRAEGDPSAHNLEALPLDELLDGLVDDCEVEAEAKGCSLERNEDRCPAWSTASQSSCGGPSRTSCATPSATPRREPRSRSAWN